MGQRGVVFDKVSASSEEETDLVVVGGETVRIGRRVVEEIGGPGGVVLEVEA